MNHRTKTITLLLLCAIAALWLPVHGQQPVSPTPLSLAKAKQIALEYNKTVQASKIDVEIARKKVIETTAIGLPQVTLSGNYQHIFKVPEFGFPSTGYTQSPLVFANGEPEGFSQFTPDNMAGVNQWVYQGPKVPIMEKDNATFDLQVSQLIFSGEYIVGLQATRVFKTISEQALKKNELDIAITIENSYHAAQIIAENLAIVQQNIALTQATLVELDAMLAAGFLEDTEVDQLRLNLTGLVNLETSMKGQLKNMHNLLKYQMGMDLSQTIELTDKIETTASILPAFAGNDFVINDNIDYQIVSNQVEVQKLNLRRQQSTFLPTLAAFYQHQEMAKEPALNFTPKDILGVSLTLPIFTSTQRLMKVKQASLELDKSKLLQSQMAEGLALQYESQKLAYETAYNNFVNQKQNCEISKRIFEKTTLKLKEGMASSLDLTQAQAQYLSATGNYYTSLLNLLNAKSELNRLTSKQQ